MSNIYLLKLNFHDNDFSIVRDIRKNVFTDELGISESELFDDEEPISIIGNDQPSPKEIFAKILNTMNILVIGYTIRS